MTARGHLEGIYGVEAKTSAEQRLLGVNVLRFDLEAERFDDELSDLGFEW